ncbi:unnamed protein product [Didymodactylos carnosus]|uniref:Uncharacterized protein n=1 Tax=Didymodactylos carnosus TaxID=1234261 RepID=A0A815MPV1_9BILA|nr:unnamed protein product [Didymodactylos carnosus]CAF4307605.1 unnamed protein product [Didymodactylos carnosus]
MVSSSGKSSQISKAKTSNTLAKLAAFEQKGPITRSQTRSLFVSVKKFESDAVEELLKELCSPKLKPMRPNERKAAVGKYLAATNHAFTNSDFKVVLREKQKYKLLVKESLVIRATSPVLNGTDRSIPLYVYAHRLESNSWDKKWIPPKVSDTVVQ